MISDRFYFRRFFRKKSGAPKAPPRKRLLETLEDRILYDAVAAVTIETEDTVNLGETLPVTITFDNTHADHTGFGPWIDVAIDATGEDGIFDPANPATGTGAGLYDGFVLADLPTYLGTSLTHHVLTLDDAANGGKGVLHPFAVGPDGLPVYVSTTDPDSPFFALLDGKYQSGDLLLVIELPFGSFTPDQPAAEVEFSLNLSNLADVGATLPLSAWGGFRFGGDSLNNPAEDPVIYGAPTHLAPEIGASLAILEKVFSGPEGETATGPNHLQTYRINVDIAAGQTLADLHLFDDLPDHVQFVTISASSHGHTEISMPPTNTPGGNLAIKFDAPILGTASTTDAWIEIQFYVPRLDASGNPVLDAATGVAELVQNQAYGFGNWTPVDPRDDAVVVGFNVDGTFDDASIVTALATAKPDAAFEEAFTARSLAIQKNVRNAIDTGAVGITPGDTLEYTLDFQVSDYFAFGSIVVTDIFSDGQDFVNGSIQLQINGNTFVLPLASFDPANYTVSAPDPATGETTITFRVSDELIRLGQAGILVGGGIDPNNPSPIIPNDLTGYDNDATTGRIIYRTTILDSFRVAHLLPGQSGEASLNSRDVLTNDAEISARVLTLAPGFAPTANTVTDSSGDSVTIIEGRVEKTIYAINGMLLTDGGFDATYRVGGVPTGDLLISPNDTVTYRITYTVPSGDLEGFRITDYLPLPVFDAEEVLTFNNAAPGTTTPAVGTAKYGPTHSMHNIPAPGTSLGDPTIVRNAGSNYVDFVFGGSIDPGNTPRVVDLLFTTTVSSEPFADGLFLTNQAVASESSTQNPATASASQAVIQVVLRQPKVDIYKGVIASTQGGVATIAGGPVFADLAGNGFTGTLDSVADAVAIGALNLTTDPLPDAGDKVRFAIVAQNTGRSGAFDVTLADRIPDSYLNNYADAATLVAQTNFKVYDGAGVLLVLGTDYTLTWDAGAKTFTVELVDNNPNPRPAGLGLGYDANANAAVTNGSNSIVILYDLTVADAAMASSSVINTAKLLKYAGAEGAKNHVGATPWTDEATVVIADPAITKTLTDTGIDNDRAGGTNDGIAVIGELVEYTLTVTLPEGTTGNVRIEDLIDPRMAFVEFTGLTVSPGLTTGGGGSGLVLNSGSAAAALNAAIGTTITIAPGGHGFTIALGEVLNTNTDNAVAETITIKYTAVVLNVGTNTAGVNLGGSSTATLRYNWQDDRAASPIVARVASTGNLGTGFSTANGGTITGVALTVDGLALAVNDVVLVKDQTEARQNGIYVVTEVAGTATLVRHDDFNDAAEMRGNPQLPVVEVLMGTSMNDRFALVANVNTVNTGAVTFAPIGSSANSIVTAPPATVSVVEPVVVVSNQLSNDNATWLDDDTLTVGAGQLVYYRVIIQNTGAVWAHDVSLYDRLPNVLNIAETEIISVTSTNGATEFDIDDAGGFDNFIIVTDTFDTAKPALVSTATLASLAPGEILTIIVSSHVIDNAASASSHPNGIQVRWTSLDDGVRSHTDVDTTPTGHIFGGVHTPIVLSPHNPAAVERTGADGPNGALNDYAATDDLTNTILRIEAVDLIKELVGTQLSDPPYNDQSPIGGPIATHEAVIGEYVDYRVTFDVPKGESRDVILTDVLPAGLAFVGFLEVAVGEDVVTNVGAGNGPTGASLAHSPSATDPINLARLLANTDITLNGTQLEIDFGRIFNSEIPGTPGHYVAPQQITITYRAIVTNVATNLSGETLINTATIRYKTHFDTTPEDREAEDSAAPVTIIEPILEIEKNITPGAPYDAGDLVQYTIVIRHDAAASETHAYDLTFSDAIPDSIVAATSNAVFATTDLGVGKDITITHSVLGDISSHFEIAGGVLRTTSTADVDLLYGQTITIVVNARLDVDVPPTLAIDNTATVTWTSMDDDFIIATSPHTPDATERDGSDPSGVNNYITSDSVDFTVSGPTIDKQWKDGTLTADDTSVGSSLLGNVVVGEQLTYDILVTLPNGTTGNLSIADLLPPGLRMDGYRIITEAVDTDLLTSDFDGNLGVAYALNSDVAVALAPGDDFTWNFGNVTTTAGASEANANRFVIRVTATVANLLANQQNVGLTLPAATLTFANPNQPGPATTTVNDLVAGNNPAFTVVEPTLTVAKAVTHAPGLDAGDQVTYTITLTNTSGQTAYDITLSDELSDLLTNFGNLSVVHSAAGPITGFFEIVNDSGTYYLRTTAAADAAGSVDLAHGQTLTVVFTADIIATIGASVDVKNTVAVHWTSTDGTAHDQERTGAEVPFATAPTSINQTSQVGTLNNYALSSSVITSVTTSVTAVKSLVPNLTDPNTNAQVTPGEVVTYSITVTLPEGQAPGFTILDQIPSGMQYVVGSFAWVNVDSGITFAGGATPAWTPVVTPVVDPAFGDGTDALFQFGQITVAATAGTANNTFTFTYEAVALNNANVDGLLPGQSQHNNAASHNNGSGTTYSHSAGSVPLTAVEPQLTIGKAFAGLPPTQAGDAFAFDITLTNTGTGDAFDINLIDDLAAQYNLANIADITIQTQPAGAYVTIAQNNSVINPAGDDEVNITLNRLEAGDTVVIRITGTVNYTAQVAQTINNVASVAYSTLPGTVPGERTYDPINSSVVAFTMPDTISVKTIVATSETHTGTDGAIELLTVGEIVRYRLAITIPQGTAGNLVLTDVLPAGLQYLAGSATIAYESDAAFTTTVPAGALADGSHVTVSGQTLTFNLGAVTNNDADAGTERIFVEFNALVLNSAANNAGDTKANQFTASVNGGTTVNSTSSSVTARIVEPRVTVGKTANRAKVDGGDLITYTVTLTNTGGANGADAFNVALADALPAGLTLVGGVAHVSGVNVTGSLVATAGATSLTTAAGGFTLAHGQSAVFTYQVLVGNTVEHGDDLDNQVDITWTSLPGTGTTPNATNGTTPGASGEADGERAGTGAGQNDYADSDAVSVEVELLYSFEKTVTSTNLAATGAAQGDPLIEDLAIGEYVTYTIKVILGEGTTTGVVLKDILPTGLIYVGSSLGYSANLTPSVNPPGFVVNGSEITYTLGDVTVQNVADGASASPAANRTITLTVTARVADVPGNQSGTVLTNTAEFASGAHATPLSDTALVEIVTPALTIAKRWATTPTQAGDAFAFDIELENTGTATAFDINLIDQLAEEFTILGFGAVAIQTNPGYVTLTNNGTFAGGGEKVDVTLNQLGAGDTVVIRITGTVNATAAVSHEIENVAAVVYSTLPNGQPGEAGERTYGNDPLNPIVSNVVAFTMPATTTVKTLVGTSEAHTVGSDVAIGEIVRYRIVVTVPQGTAKNLTIVDVLPAGLEFVNDGTATLQFVADSVFTAGGALTDAHNQAIFLPAGAIAVTGQTIAFGLGDVVNHDNDANIEQVIIEFSARVLNVAGNFAGGTPANNATTRVEDEDGDLVDNSAAAPVPVTIVEPSVALTKAVVPGPYDAGDVVSYTFTLTNTGTGTGFDLRVVDDLPAAFASINSVAITAGPGSLTNNSVGTDLDFVINQLAAGGTVTVTVTATLAATTAPGLLVENTAALTYTSLPGTGTGLTVTAYDTVTNAPGVNRTSTPGTAGTSTGERTGADGIGGLNDYSGSDDADFTVPSALALAKTIVTTSLGADTSLNVVIGEVITYRLNVTLQQGQTSVVTLSDTLELGLGYLGTTAFFRSADGVTAVGGTSGISYTNGSLINAADLSWNAATGAFEVRLGNVTVPATAANGTGAFQIEYNARVENIAGNQDATPLDNSAVVRADRNGDGDTGDAGETSAPSLITVTVIEPTLTLTKTTVTPGADGGDTVVYELVIENTGNAAAYDILISDLLDASLRLDPANLTTALAIQAGGPAYATLNQSGNTAAAVSTVLNRLDAGDTITVRITAEVRAGAAAGATVENTATVSYTSLPGADGNERTGVDSDPLNDYITTAASGDFVLARPDIDKALFATSESATAGSFVAIGETVTYSFLVTLPEGLTPSVVITDFVPAGMAYVGHTLVTTVAGSGGLLTADYNGTVALTSVVGSGDGVDVVFTFGDVTTVADNVAGNNHFVLLVELQALNVAGNQSNTVRTNEGQLAYTDGTGGANTPVDAGDVAITLVEPQLEVGKTITSDVTNLDAGDTVTYEIRVRHTALSTAGAFDVVIADQLPAELRNYTLVSAVIGATDVSGALTLNATTGALSTTGVIDLAQGNELVITLSGVVRDNTTVGTTITNEALLYWSSLEGGQRGDQAGTGTERTGVGGGVNTYAGDDDVSATTRGHLAIAKSADRTEATIGEIITYTLTVTVAEGRTVVNFTDTLPANTVLVANSVQIGANLANLVITGLNANSVTGQTITVETNHATGTVANDGAVAQNATFTLTYQAQVQNVAANSGLAGGQTDLDNSVAASADLNNDGDATDPGETGSDTHRVTVIEPRVSAAKTVTSATTGLDAGDRVTYQIVLTNAAADGATATAFDVTLSDVLPAGLLIETIDVPVLMGGATVKTALSGATTGTLAGIFNIPVNGTVTITYTAVLQNSVTPDLDLTNNVDVRYSSLDGTVAGERDGSGVANPADNTHPDDGAILNNYAVGSAVTVTMASPFAVAKSIANTSLGNDTSTNVVVGEVVTYALGVTVMQGTTENIELVDTLAAGLVLDLASVAVFDAAGMTITNFQATQVGQVLTITIDSVMNPGAVNAPGAVNTGTFTIRYDAVVANVSANTTGQTLANSVDASADDVPDDNGNTTTVTVIEPVLTLAKTTITAGADGGDTVVYELVIENTGNAAAHDILISDLLDASLRLDPANLTTALAIQAGGPAYATLNQSGNTAAAVSTVLNRLDAGDTITVRITAEVRAGAVAGATVANTATVTYTSLPGTDGNERTGVDGDPLNDYIVTAASPTTFTLATPTLDKALVATSEAYTSGNRVTVGEVLTFDLLVILPEGVTLDLVVTDLLPPGLAYVGHSIITLAAGSTLLTADYAGTVSAPTVTSATVSGQDVIFDFGDITTDSDNVAGNNRFVIRVEAVVVNEAGNVDGTTLTNDASLAYTHGTTLATTAVASASTPAVTVVEPQLEVAKTITSDVTNLDAGDTVTYEIRVRHTALSTADAFDVVITDQLPAELRNYTLVSAVIGVTDVSGALTLNATTGALSTTGTIDVAEGTELVITLSGVVRDNTTVGATITNEAFLYWSSLEGGQRGDQAGISGASNDERTGVGGGVNTYAGDDDVSATTRGHLAIAKSADRTEATIGEIITYTLTVTVAEGRTVVNFTDTLPANTVLVANSVQIGANLANLVITGLNANSVTGQTITVETNHATGTVANNGAVAQNATFTLTYQVRVLDEVANSGLPGGQTDLDNSVAASADLNNDGDATDPNEEVTDTETVVVVEPQLVVTKTAGDADRLVTPGSTVTYTVDVENRGTAAAHNVVITDAIDAGVLSALTNIAVVRVDLSDNSTTALVAGVDYTVTSGLTGWQVTLTGALADGFGLRVAYDATYVNTLTAGADLDNNVRATFTSLANPGDDDVRSYVPTGTEPHDHTDVTTPDEWQDTERVSVGTGSVSDYVWFDLNGDGVQDANEAGIAGVRVWIDMDGDGAFNAAHDLSAVTDSSGNYLITGLAPGAYTVRVDFSTLPGAGAGIAVTYDLDDGVTTPDGLTAITVTAVNPTGDAMTDVDFGFRGAGSLGDFVWLDLDGDGAVSGLEKGIEGVVLELIWDVDGNGYADANNPVIATTTTDAGGLYSFGDLLAGGYRVVVAAANFAPGGVLADATATYDLDGGGATPAGVSTTTLATNTATDTTLDFGYQGAASIGDRVWNDFNGDGVQDADEFGISGLTLQLEQFIGGAWVAIATATTGTNGAYDFSGLIADDYRVTVLTPPASATLTSVDTPDVTFDPATHQAVRTVGSAEQADDLDFGYEGQASLAGIVWFDQNADGSQLSDPPLDNVRVSIVVDGVTTEILTDATGYYEFTGLIAGTYTVVVDETTLPLGLRLPTYDRDNGLVNPDGEAVVPLTPTQAVTDAHFGYQGEYTISGHSYRDTDKGGARNAGDTGIGGVTIELIWDANNDGIVDAGDTIITSVVTDADGYYEFNDLIIGNYLVRETQPAGFGQGENSDLIDVVVAHGTDNSARNFGNTTGSLAGTVFRDDNNDGAQAAGEDGLAGVTLYLDLWDAVLGAYVEIGTTVTDAAGNYLFDHANTDFTIVSGFDFGATTGGLLATGEYRLREDQPAGHLDGADTAGNATVAAGTVAGTHQGRDGSDAIAGIRVDPGQDVSGYTFAELLPSSLSGHVYIDHNGDGLLNPWESGLAGVTITLTGVNDIGEVIEVDVVTDADGYYEFTGLRPSDGSGYTLTQRTQPPGYSDGTDNLGGFAAGSGNTAGDDTVPNEFSGILVVDLAPGANEGVNYNFGETFDFVLNKQVVGTSLGSSAGSAVVVGEVIRYRLTVNVPHGTLTDFQLHDQLPAGLRFLDDGTATATLSANLAAAPLTVSASPIAADPSYGSGTDVYFKLGTVTNTNPADSGGETLTIEFNAVVVNEVANAAGTGLANAFTVRFDTTGDNVADDTPVTSPPETVTVIEPALTLAKSADDTTPHLGQTVVYTIDVFNEATATSATAYDLVVTDVLPPLVVTALGNITVTLHDMAGTAATGDDVALGVLTAGVDYTVVSTLEGWTITFSELAPDHRIEIAYEVVISELPTDVLGAAGLFGGGDDAFDNTVTLDWSSLPSGHPDEPGERDYTTDETLTTTVVGADLELVKTGPATVAPGETFAYVFTLTNHGTDTATGVVLTDLLPAQVTFFAALGSDAATYVPVISTIDDQQQVVFALPDIAAGDTFELTVSVTFAPVADAAYEAMVNSARVTHDDIDPTSPDVANPPYDDNADSHPTTIQATPGIGVTKQLTSVNNGAVPLDGAGQPIVTAGDTVIYTIVLSNTGNQNTLVNVVDTFPIAVLDLANAVIDDSQTGVSAVIDLDAGTITWTGVSLEVGRPITITIEAAAFNPQSAGLDDFDNTVLVTTNNPENPSETGLTAEDGEKSVLDAAPDLVVTKVNSTDVVDLVDPFTYTITVTNNGDQDATDVTIVDVLSPFAEFVGASGHYVYDAQTHTVTWSSADNPELRLLPGGGAETHTFTITTRLSLGAISFDPLVNTVRVFDDGLNGPDRNPDDNEAQTASEVMAYLYDSIRNFAKHGDGEDDEWGLLGLPIKIYRDAILPIPPIYSGSAEPGSTLEVVLYNADGHVIGHQTVVVDAGGNWMASFPGTIMKDYPQSVVITQTLSNLQVEEARGYNLRPYYATAINTGQFFRENLNVTRLTEQTAANSGAALQEAMENPISFNIGMAAYETLAAPGQPSGR